MLDSTLPSCYNGSMPKRPVPIEQRFWPKVKKTDGCWEWIASTDHKGYGWIGLPGRPPKMGKAHRVSWELHFGQIPDGLWVLHHCDNPSCVRPDHLFLGTNADNVRDMHAKGRHRKHRPDEVGELNPMAKLSWAQVSEIRDRYHRGSVSQEQLGNEYGVAQTAISRIIRGIAWPEGA